MDNMLEFIRKPIIRQDVRFAPPLVALIGGLNSFFGAVDPARRMSLLNNDTVALGDDLELRMLLIDLLGLDALSFLLLTLEQLQIKI